jgi:protein lysine acetyltransferase
VAESITARANELANLSVFADCFGADLYPLALLVEPVHAEAGNVLMRQGEPADFFLIIADGSAAVQHTGPDGATAEINVGAGRILGEIALLRHSMRSATVIAAEDLSGWTGDDDAFDQLIELPGVLAMLVRTARQRVAEFIEPITFRLRDGTELLLRPVLPGDGLLAEKGSVEFSDETMYRRFMTAREPTQALMDYLVQVDYVNHFVWVVVDVEKGNIVADVRYVREQPGQPVAEIAFIVGDDYQGRGVGSFLMKALVIAAHVGGIEKFTARVLSDNQPMRTILDKFGAEWQREDLGVVTTVMDVPDLRDVNLPPELTGRIRGVAHQVLEALG